MPRVRVAGPRRIGLQPEAFACQVNKDGLGIACVSVAGELDIASAPGLERILRRTELGARLLVLDLHDLTFMDSAGLRLLVATNDRAQQTGCRLVVVPGPPQVQRLLALSPVADELEVAEPGDIDPAAQVLLRAARSG